MKKKKREENTIVWVPIGNDESMKWDSIKRWTRSEDATSESNKRKTWNIVCRQAEACVSIYSLIYKVIVWRLTARSHLSFVAFFLTPSSDWFFCSCCFFFIERGNILLISKLSAIITVLETYNYSSNAASIRSHIFYRCFLRSMSSLCCLTQDAKKKATTIVA